MTTESQQNINTQEEDISLKDLILKVGQWWRYLLSKWLIILVFGFIGGALGFTYAYFKKPIYTATTTFVLEDEKSGGGLGNLAGLASMAGVDLGGGGGGIFQGDNILE
ncbi:MAG: lipopolysaccharide biosynthesis protein, partial [Flavobacterium sp.]